MAGVCTDLTCSCEPEGMYRCEYRRLADAVIAELNPPDGEDDEGTICANAVRAIVEYVDSLPCTCTPDVIHPLEWADPCTRCRVLGRRKDQHEDR